MYKVAFSLLSFALSLCCYNASAAENVASPRKVVVIDAGHGGLFPGAEYGGVSEKTLTLQVAIRLGRMIEERMKDVDVVYTRTTDVDLAPRNVRYVTNKERLKADLQRRTDIANGRVGKDARSGDLLISIHVNAARATSANGTETLIMGESDYEVGTNEKVLTESLIEDFVDMNDSDAAAAVRAYVRSVQYTYGKYSYALARIIQRNYEAIGRRSHEYKGDHGVKKQMIKVLYGAEMPCVLTEIGFMSNAAELAYLRSEKGQKALAGALCRSVEEYFAFMRGELSVDDDQPAEPSESESSADAPAAADSAAPQTGAPASAAAPETKPAAPAAVTAEKPAAKPAAASAGSWAPKGYTVQVKASGKTIPSNSRELKGFGSNVRMLRGSGRYPYRYCIGSYATADEARSRAVELRKVFDGAFVVQYDGDKIVK